MVESIHEILKKNINNLRYKYPFESMALFGSVNRSDFNAAISDIDILVDYQSSDVMLFLKLAEDLEQLLNHKVDLVTKRSLKPRQLQYLENQLRYV